ncbi:MAG: fimbrillin family protein [Bacteroidaceae bacterium]|nr:fimbrillin family protein [Bacteroidaceae bacterium]
MKKDFLLIATAATMLTACVNLDTLNGVDDYEAPGAIGFSTLTNNQTKAENSSATEVDPLKNYNTTFKVWGSKFFPDDYKSPADADNLPDEERVFGIDNTGEIVSYVSSAWTYSPLRFWDKSATSYSFYAAAPSAPSGTNWVWNNATKKLSIADFAITGYNSVTGDPATEVDVDKVLTENLDTEDLMISTDLTGYNTYTTAKVNLHFNHILSRLNIGVRKAAILDAFDVKLNSIKVFNMKSNGTFDESLESGEDLANGTIARWATAPTTPSTFTEGVGYTPASALEITSTASDESSYYQYVYEGLVIPQAVAYNPTVEVASTVENGFKLNGSTATTSSNPYIVIDYEIWTKAVAAVNFTQDEIENAQEGDPAYGKTTDDVKTPAVAAAKMDGYKYFYNLADAFNGAETTAVNFYEGWQNTLKITLSPVAIEFDADVYEWVPKTQTSVDITE